MACAEPSTHAQVPSLTPAASRALDENGKLYSIVDGGKVDANVVDFEQITYLLNLDSDADLKLGAGSLITFQEGKAGDVFGEVRSGLASKANRVRSRGVPYLFLQLILASTESAVHISSFTSSALDQLDDALDQRPNSLELINHAHHIADECGLLLRNSAPFADALTQLVAGDFPPQVMGKTVSAWASVKMQMHRLVENVKGEQTRAERLVEQYRERQAKRQEEAQARIERSQNVMSLVLSIFSPLAFISGI